MTETGGTAKMRAEKNTMIALISALSVCQTRVCGS